MMRTNFAFSNPARYDADLLRLSSPSFVSSRCPLLSRQRESLTRPFRERIISAERNLKTVQTTHYTERVWSRKSLLYFFLVSMSSSGLANAANAPVSSRALILRGMEFFKRNEVEESIADFDKSIEAAPDSADYLWQRGLSLYYVDRFEDAAEQFQRDVRLNPRDTEESIWRLISQARQSGLDFKKAQKLMIPIEGESRPYMRTIYEVFAGKKPVAELEALSQKSFEVAKSNSFLSDKEGAIRTNFYCLLYLGLLAEAQGDAEKAKKYVVQAAQSPYSVSGDYMYFLAVVHCSRRGWQWT